MIIRTDSTCENKYDICGNKAKHVSYKWKRKHYGLFKVWFGYEIYLLIDEKNNRVVHDKNGKTFYGEHLERIEIKWGWK